MNHTARVLDARHAYPIRSHENQNTGVDTGLDTLTRFLLRFCRILHHVLKRGTDTRLNQHVEEIGIITSLPEHCREDTRVSLDNPGLVATRTDISFPQTLRLSLIGCESTHSVSHHVDNRCALHWSTLP